MQDQTALLQALQNAGLSAQAQVPLAPYTTFRIGGPAAVFCTPASETELITALRICKEKGECVYLLGRGSNTLFADEGFDGLVIHIAEGLDAIEAGADGTIMAGAGTNLIQLCKKAEELSLTGLEFAYGIPGSVGGAVYMNAGAYDGEMKNILAQVRWLDDEGNVQTSSGEALELGYRCSRFSKHGGVVLGAVFHLAAAPQAQIHARMEELRARRIEKQPLDKPSAGSTFKRPKGAFAAALIDECGLKGLQVGGAAVSEKHSGFVVNLGGATCADVLELCEQVAARVYEQTGHQLEKEVKVVK